MDTFNPANRCSQCGGDATFKYHASHRCADTAAAHMHRRCEDCGFSWREEAPSAPMATTLSQSRV
jgi:DNA-directed RNA polymerase subunit M/transcription elongation factor TFIIS